MTNKELYTRCLELSYKIREYRNQFIALLPEVNRRQLYLEHGMHSIYEFAAKLGCLTNKTVDRVLNTKSKLKDKPLLNAMFEDGSIGWSKFEVIAPIVTVENEKDLARILPTISKNALATMVKDKKTESFAGESGHEGSKTYSTEFEKFSAKLDPELISQLKVLQLKLEKKTGKILTWNETFKEMVIIVDQAITPKERKSKPIKVTTRYIPAAKKREVLNSTNNLCAKCNRPAEHLHHENPYTISKNHDSIIPLCKAHHDIEHHKNQSYVDRQYQEYKRIAMWC